MTTLTIPQRITGGEALVVLPKKEWQTIQRMIKMKISEMETERELREALREVKEGKMIGPFDKAEDLIKALEK